MISPCNCTRPHLTREHLYTKISWNQDGQPVLSMKNPYFIGTAKLAERHNRSGKSSVDVVTSTTPLTSSLPQHQPSSNGYGSRWTPKPNPTFNQTNGHSIGKWVNRKPLHQQSTTINSPNVGSFVSLLKPTSTSSTAVPSPVKSKFQVWNAIKNSFQECRKLGPKNGLTVNCSSNSSKVIHQSESINGVTVFRMKNPFASKVNVPIDELTKLFCATIDTIKEERIDSSQTTMDLDSTIDQLISSTILPLTPVSPTSPMSTSSILTDNHMTPTTINLDNKQETEVKVKIEGGDTVIFKEVSDFYHSSPPSTTTIFDDICIQEFNEYEFDRMISNLPDVA